MSLGAAIAQWLTARLLGPLSWQQILAIYAVPGLVWAAVFALAIPRLDPPAVSITAKASPVRWFKLIADTQMQLICAQQFLRAGATSFFYTWCPRFFMETFGVSQREAGELASAPPLAGMFGGFLGGVISEWLLRRTGSTRVARQGLACATMILCATCATLAFFVNDKMLAVALLCVGNFFAQACGAAGYAVAITYGGKRVATVFATMNMSGNVGAGVFPLAVGWLARLTGNWNLVLLVIASLFASSGVCWAFLKPAGTLFDDEAIKKVDETFAPN
jgi:nitrate/nitrite transporter NarK